MVRYIGPKIKIVRRLGVLPGLTRKVPKLRKNSPGEHGRKMFFRPRRMSLSGDYRDRLFEKQKLRFNYGITEKQLISYYQRAKKKKTETGTTILQLLESRLDSIVYRLGFAPTIPAARQLINHKHIFVNNKLVSIPSFLCCKGDLLSIKSNTKSQKIVSSNVQKIQEKRNLVLKRIQQSFTKKKFQSFRKKYTFKTLLPSYLKLDAEKLQGKLIGLIKRRSIILRIKELKVVEFYSR